MKVAVASGKGGTGKTTLATNLADYIATRPADDPAGSAPVVLVDLDVGEPNSGLFVQGELVYSELKYRKIPEWRTESCSRCGLCQEVCNFNAILQLPNEVMVFPALCHGCYVCSELCPTESLPMCPETIGELKHFRAEGFDFIESRLKIGEEQEPPLINQTLAYVADQAPVDGIVILDAPPGTSCPVIAAVKDADLVILVTDPTPFGLHDLKLAVETVRGLGREFGVVLNRQGLGDDRVERYCADANIPVIARIPNSREIAEAYAAGRMLHREIPSVADAMRATAAYILARRRPQKSQALRNTRKS